jgi:hypothetical protein
MEWVERGWSSWWTGGRSKEGKRTTGICCFYYIFIDFIFLSLKQNDENRCCTEEWEEKTTMLTAKKGT